MSEFSREREQFSVPNHEGHAIVDSLFSMSLERDPPTGAGLGNIVRRARKHMVTFVQIDAVSWSNFAQKPQALYLRPSPVSLTRYTCPTVAQWVIIFAQAFILARRKKLNLKSLVHCEEEEEKGAG